ncbi:MAG TPA: sugar ABC transporter substrate-binding protein [Candidatus Baltobacteraceae bacterium]|nr:sugar ABC transporter substrate-binding protein [Candidatus Baltobacteraceae bacterium]
MRYREHRAERSGLSRRQFLRAATTAAIGLPAFLRNARAGDSFSWRRYAGQSLFVQLTKHPWSSTIIRLVPEFEKQTGIKVEVSELPELQARQKLTVEFTAGAGGIDAWLTFLPVEKRRFWRAGWYADLGKFLADPTMTAPEYDWNDIAPVARAAATQPDETIAALPIFVDSMTLFYRKDLFQQKGLKPPRTLADIEASAQQFHDPKNHLHGFIGRGLKNANAPPWNWALYSMGGNFLTKDRKANLQTPEAIKAMDWYAGMLRRFAPPGVVNYNWYECSSAFMQGQAAMYLDAIGFGAQFEDKEKSQIAGKVGYMAPPAGPAGRFSTLSTNAVGVSALSKRQGPAYFFIQWATSKPVAAKALVDGTLGPRASIWDAPEVKAKARMPPDWAQAARDSLKVGVPSQPEIVGVTEYRDLIGVAIQRAIEGARSDQVLAQAQREFQEVLDQTEK